MAWIIQNQKTFDFVTVSRFEKLTIHGHVMQFIEFQSAKLLLDF